MINARHIKHRTLIERLYQQGYPSNHLQGMCHGIVRIYRDLAFKNRLDLFYEIINAIDVTPDLSYHIKKAKEKVKKNEPLNRKEKIYLFALPYFEEAELYLNPELHKDIFKRYLRQEDVIYLDDSLPIMEFEEKKSVQRLPEEIKTVQMERKQQRKTVLKEDTDDRAFLLDESIHQYNQRKLQIFLNKLRDRIIAAKKKLNLSDEIIVELGSIDHSICFSFDTIHNEWVFVDPNKLTIPPKRVKHHGMPSEIMTSLTDTDIATFKCQIFIPNRCKAKVAPDMFKPIHQNYSSGFKNEKQNVYKNSSILEFLAQFGTESELRKYLNIEEPFLAESKEGREALENLTNVLSKTYGEQNQTLMQLLIYGKHLWFIDFLGKHFSLEKRQEILNFKNGKGFPPLNHAVITDQADMVELLIKNGANPKLKTPAHYAAARGYVKALMVLIGAKVDLNLRDDEGNCPIHYAAIKGDVEILKVLADSKADLNKLTKPKKGIERFTALHFAVQQKQVHFVRQLVENYRVDINQTTDMGRNVFHVAVVTKSYSMFKTLLELNADFFARDKYGRTPFYYMRTSDIEQRRKAFYALFQAAIETGTRYLVEYLLNAYISDVYLTKFELNGLNAIGLAAKYGHTDIIKLLKSRSFSTSSDQDTHYVHLAMEHKDAAKTKEMIHLYKSKLAKVTTEGENTVHFAARAGNIMALDELYKLGTQVDLLNKAGYAPVHLAVEHGQLSSVQELGKISQHLGADLLSQPTKNEKWTPLHIAARLKRTAIAIYLINEAKVNCNERDTKGWTPAHYAAWHGSDAILLNLLAHKHINVEEKTPDGRAIVHLLFEAGQLDMLQKLNREHKLDLNLPTLNGKTISHLAVEQGEERNLDRLLNLELNVNFLIPDDNANTALDYAAQLGMAPTLLHLAVTNNRVDIVQELLRNPEKYRLSHKDLAKIIKIASEIGNVEILRLCSEAKLDISDALFFAAQIHSKDAFDKLIESKELSQFKQREYEDDEYSDKFLLIHVAAKKGNLEFFQHLIQKGYFGINDTSSNSSAPIYFAAAYGNHEIVRWILEQPESKSIPTEALRRAILIAAENGQAETIKVFLDKIPDLSPQIKTEILFTAAEHNQAEIFNLFAEKEMDINPIHETKGTPLHAAAQNGNLNVVQEIFAHIGEYKSIDPNQVFLGKTPLHLAIENRHFDVMKELVANGANVNILDQQEYSLVSRTIVRALLKPEDTAAIVYLMEIKNADFTSRDKRNKMPLDYARGDLVLLQNIFINAAKLGRIDIINELLNPENEFDIDVKVLTQNGMSAFHLAAQEGHLEVFNRLMKCKTADAQISGSDSIKPLHAAAAKNQLNVVNAIIAIDPHSVTSESDNGNTPLHTAARTGSVAVFKALIQAEKKLGHDEEKSAINHLNKDGLLPLHRAAQSKAGAAIIKQCAAHFDINALTRTGATAIHVAIESFQNECLEELINVALNNAGEYERNRRMKPRFDLYDTEHGFNAVQLAAFVGNIDAIRLIWKNKDKLTQHASYINFSVLSIKGEKSSALHLAVEKGHDEIVHEFIIHCGMDVNQRTEPNLKTSVHLAVHAGNIVMLRKLRELGADFNLKDKDGLTPFQYAMQNGDKEVIQFFLDNQKELKINLNHLFKSEMTQDDWNIVARFLVAFKCYEEQQHNSAKFAKELGLNKTNFKALEQHRKELGIGYKEVLKEMPQCERVFCQMETVDEKNVFAQLVFSEPPRRRFGVFAAAKPEYRTYQDRQVLAANWTLICDTSVSPPERKEEVFTSHHESRG